jgi:hypothetical protein
MSRYKTVVKVMVPEMDDEGNYLDKDGKPIEYSNKTKTMPEPAMKEALYYLLHWGLHMEILVDKDGNRYPASYTVGICQHIKDGRIKIFAPEELTVLGKGESNI